MATSFPSLELISLATMPSLHYQDFIRSVRNASSLLCPEHYPNQGLQELYVGYTAAQYIAADVHTMDNTQNPPVRVPTPRPQLPVRPARPGGNAPAATVTMYNLDLQVYNDVMRAMGHLRLQVLQACGTTICEELNNLAGGLPAQSLPQILTYLETRYGTPNEHDYAVLQGSLNTKFTSAETFRDEAPRMNTVFIKLAKSGQPLSELQKIRHLELATHLLPSIVAAIREYKRVDDDVSTWSFDDLVTYILRHAPHLMTSSDLGYVNHATSAGAVPALTPSIMHSSSDFTALSSALQAILPTMLQEHLAANTSRTTRVNDNAARTRTAQARSGNQQSGTNNNRTRTAGGGPRRRAPNRPYCFEHGYGTHTGLECRTMQGNAAYSDAMRNASGPATIDGYLGAGVHTTA